jgi:murein biosynthesis integral membrane protein MurJ
MTRSRLSPSAPLTLFLLYFCYATSAALIFQKFLVPLIPSLHAGQGLLQGDAAYFHSVAVNLVERIQHDGWGVWSFHPSPGSGVNVAVLAVLYLLFGPDPSLVTPINAGLHAFGGLLIVLLGRALWPGKVGEYAGVVAGTLFVAFPSALNWYGQIHKDGYAIAGTLLTVYCFLRLGEPPATVRSVSRNLLGVLAGTLLIISVRPYNLLLLTFGLAVAYALIAVPALARKRDAIDLASLAAPAVAIALVALFTGASPSTQSVRGAYSGWEGPGKFEWQTTAWVPQVVNGYAEVLARTRSGMIAEGRRVGAGSQIDEDVTLSSVEDLVRYVPRALQITLFAPFPSKWFEKLTPTRLVAVVEMLLWYAIAPGLLLALVRLRTPAVMAVIALSLAIMAVYGLTLANVGTLYRVRYPYLFLLMLIALAGWADLFLRRGWIHAGARRADPVEPVSGQRASTQPAEAPLGEARSTVFSTGALVAALTGLAYLGLFVRDIMMARMFGLGAELDAFVVATLVPMLLVTVFSAPVGTTAIPAFLELHPDRRRAQELVRLIAFAFMCFAALLALVLVLAAPLLIPAIGWNFPPQKIERTITIMMWMVPIFVLSGMVVLGNALLNALGRYTVPASAQATVALFAILALFLFGREHGALAAVAGMFVGQVANLSIVIYLLGKQGVSLMPVPPRSYAGLRPLLDQYLPLVAAAIFVNLAGPVNAAMASALPEGSVAALSLGVKIVLFTTGVVGAAVATVMLPYFSRVLARHNTIDANRELSFFIVAASAITIPASIAIYTCAEAIVRLAFQGGQFQADDVVLVARVLGYGILQLPFFTVNLVLVKFAIASRRAQRALLASVIGLAANVVLNLLLMERLGVAGIALATTLSIACSTAVLLFVFHRRGHIAWVDLIMIALNWMMFMTFAVCLHFRSYAGVIATFLAFSFLALGEWRMLLTPTRRAPG